MWNSYYNAASIDEALQALAIYGERARIVAGGTDLILELERGARPGVEVLIDVTRIPCLGEITLDEECNIHLGPMVTHNQCVASKLIVEQGFPLARAAVEVGAPQIRNRGSVAGNLITASPANDTIPALMALGAKVRLESVKGEREVPLEKFYTGVRKNVMRPDEMLTDIVFPALGGEWRGTFYKLGLRRAQAISVVNCAVLLKYDGEVVQEAVITLGAVTPIIVHAEEAEKFLVGRKLDEETMATAAQLAQKAARPIDDVRASKEYRLEMVRICVLRSLRAIAKGEEQKGFPTRPVLLCTTKQDWGVKAREIFQGKGVWHHKDDQEAPIVTRINGKEYRFEHGQQKTLLRLLREDARLIGTKEGCAEGECGACTLFLDGMAVMSCLVPAPRAHGAEITTIEGLATEGVLHPVQQSFIEQGAVQCGYCTPGFLMSAAMLLDEYSDPTREEIKLAISGNLCRCTGYYSIISAIEQAAAVMAVED
jgi:carbon-monoxide dehydrogenase medium subunit